MAKFLKQAAFITAIFSSCCLSLCFGADDGFGSGQKAESRHFTIYYAQGLNPGELAQTLDLGTEDRVLGQGSHGSDLGSLIDALFERVCNILDMQLYSYHGVIKVCRDFDQLNSVYNNLFDKDLTNRYSFYVHNLNTIYISAQHFKREVLGHEIGHAVISNYFVVLPSVKVQEVLATYVEYQLRKF
jgi:hypothetical protein